MKTLSLMLALLAGCLLPVTALTQDSKPSDPTTTSSARNHHSKRNKSSKSDNPKLTSESEKTVQNEENTFTETQLELNRQARVFMEKKEYDSVERFYQSSLNIKPYNITHLQLASIYTIQNKCKDAFEELEKVNTAPQIVDPDYPPEAIAEYAKYLNEKLNEMCSARIQLFCDPESEIFKIKIDDWESFECTQTKALVVPITPGDHTVLSSCNFGVQTQYVNTFKNETINVFVTLHSDDFGLKKK